MPTIHFRSGFRYRILPGYGLQPLLDVTLILGSIEASVPGLVDSGASSTVFSLDVADALGIHDISEGRPFRANTLAGAFGCFMFDLEIEVRLPEFRRRFPAQVGFYGGRGSRNLLGRNLLFSHFVIGFQVRQQKIFFQPED